MIEGFKAYTKRNKKHTAIYSLLVGICSILATIIFIFLNMQGWKFILEYGLRKNEIFVLIGYSTLLFLSGGLILMIQRIKRRYKKLEYEKTLLTKEIEEYKIQINGHHIYGTMDGMTEVYNRSFGLSFLDQQIKIAKRESADLTIIYLDINDLKIVNDTYGHSAGDRLIILACNILKENLRESDILCRMGGDEFLMILPGCPLEQAELVINRIMNSIEDSNQKPKSPYKLSISIGKAAYSVAVDMDLQQFINQADANMYDNKRHVKQKKAARANE